MDQPPGAAFPRTATRAFSNRRSLISFVTTNALFKLIWSPSGRIRFTFFGSLGNKIRAAFDFVALRFEVQSKIVFRF